MKASFTFFFFSIIPHRVQATILINRMKGMNFSLLSVANFVRIGFFAIKRRVVRECLPIDSLVDDTFNFAAPSDRVRRSEKL